MPKSLTPAQRQYVEALILPGQRVEFTPSSESFWLYSEVEVHVKQFASLPTHYQIWSVSLSAKPFGSDTVRPHELMVQFVAS